MKKIVTFFITNAFVYYIAALVASAQNQLQLIAPIPTYQGSNIPDPAVYIKALYQFGLGIGGALAMFMIVWGGVEWAISGAVDRKAAAKQRITKAILGLVLLLASVFILNLISPNLTNLNAIIPKL